MPGNGVALRDVGEHDIDGRAISYVPDEEHATMPCINIGREHRHARVPIGRFGG
jgi:hypothetical protein